VPGITSWAPTLDGVARHIPTRTRDTRTPGKTTLAGTFTEATTPTAEQAQQDLDAAVRAIIAEVGDLPASPAIEAVARDAAEWRAAADIEVAYPDRSADVAVARDLDARAKDALARLKVALTEAGAGQVEDSPQWAFPEPVPWGDEYL
jgi:hypothetical protein